MQRTQCKRKVFLHGWSNSVGTIGRKDKNAERDNGAIDDSNQRFAVANQDRRSDKTHRSICGSVGGYSKFLLRASWLYGPVSSNLPGEVHVISQRKQTLTIIRTHWQSDIFIGRSMAGTLWTSNKQASKEQLKKMSKQLTMKFMLQCHKLPKSQERKCGKG